MSGGLQTAAAATAAVFLGESRVGTGVLVDGRHLLTAEHVMRRQGALADAAEVLFPSGPAPDTRNPVTRLALSPECAADVAVLELRDTPSAELPRPVALWPAARLPEQVSVFGFPRAERDPTGWWRDFDVSGPVGRNLVQLNWATGLGTLTGHSGGPVLDAETGALVGVVAEGAEAGRFDRFVPLPVVARCWPGLRRPWLMAGAEGRGHFTRRARGQRSRARGGDLFRGRAAALAAVRAWVTAEDDPGRPLVVTGQPGAGKSAVLARTVLTLEADGVGPGLAFHARGATHTDLLRAVADLTGHEGDLSRDGLLDALAGEAASEPTRWLVICDALDEAANPVDRDDIAATLTELAQLPEVRVGVGTRPLASGDRYGPGALLPELRVRSPESAALVDLDTDRYFDADGLRDFAVALLTQHSAPRPDRAAAAYRANPALCRRLAGVIAKRAGRNHLVAALAAAPLSEQHDPVDLDAPGFDPRSIPSGVGEALTKYLQRLPEHRGERAGQLLTALAYARGDGLDDQLWLRFTHALGYPAEQADLDRLRTGGAADYLLQTLPDGAQRVTRLFHQALIDELLARRHHPTDERALLSILRQLAGETGWDAAPPYLHRHTAEHGAAAAQLENLLDDLDYLAAADFTRLLPLLPAGSVEHVNPLVAVLHRSGARAARLPAGRRLGLLALTAAHLGLPVLQHRLGTASNLNPRIVWAHSLGVPHRELTDHTGTVSAVALGRGGGRDLVVSGGADGTVRLWDAATGQALGEPLTGHTDWVRAVAIGRAGARDLIVSGGHDGTVRLWDPATGQAVGEPLTGHTHWVNAVALGHAAGRDLIVSGGDDGTVRLWDPATGQAVGEPLTGHTGAVNAVALGRAGGRDLIVSGGADGTVRLWDPATHRPVGDPLTGHTHWVNAVALGHAAGRDLVVSAGDDGTVRLWDPATGQHVGEPLTGHTGWVRAVALGRAGGRDLILSGGADGTVRLWDPATHRPVGDPLTGHTHWVNAVALGHAGGRDLIVSGGADSTARLWDPPTGRPTGDPLTGHTGWVFAVALGHAAGRHLVLSGGDDATVRLWDPLTGRPTSDPLTGHAGAVNAVALGHAAGRDLVVSGGHDGTVRVWDPATGQPVGQPLTGHAGAVNAVALGHAAGRDLVVSGGDDATVRLWDPATGESVGQPLTGHASRVFAVALGQAAGRDLVVSGAEGTVRLWEPATGQPVGHPLKGHASRVNAVALGHAAGRDLVVSGGHDGTVRIWDPATGQPVGQPLTGHTGAVNSVALGHAAGHDLIVSGGADSTVRIWDAATTHCEDVVDLLGPIQASAIDGSGTLCAAVGRAVCAFAEAPVGGTPRTVP